MEGKTCKTGRTNNNTTKITAPVSAPPQISTSSSSKDLPIDSTSDQPHSVSAMGNHNEERPQTTKDQNESLSSNSTLDKIDDYQYHYQPNDTNKSNNTRHKHSGKTKSNRISVDTLPIRRLSRTKINARIESGKK